MSDYELRADSWQNWPAEFFDREDPAPDEQFYMEPRKVVHIVLLLASAERFSCQAKYSTLSGDCVPALSVS